MIGRTRRYCVLNVVAHPHPDGVYREVFKNAAGHGVKFWGQEYAALSPVTETENNVFSGRLAIWTQVDKNSDVIKLESFEELSLSDSGVNIPNNIGLNSKVFVFAFNIKTHRMYIELRNDEKKSISPNRAELAVSRILGQLNFTEVDDLNVTLVPSANSVENILSMPKLKRVEMRIHRPNPDSFEDDAQEVLAELNSQGAQKQDIIITKAAGFDTLALNAKNILLAKVSALNGYLKGTGATADGEKIEASTKDTPMIISMASDEDTTSSGQVKHVARRE